jgi:putative endonuclease
MKEFCVYILRCCDGSLYVGVTSDLRLRLEQHLTRQFPDCYTAERLPVQLAFVRYFPSSGEAFAFEKQLKNWSRAKKEALVEGDILKLKELASCRNQSHHSNRS